jgi:Domain of unknown function (DUF1707)
MAGLSDEIAARGRGHLRASHMDREYVIEILKAAFVQGMLAKDEFDQRVGQTFASRTYAELAAVTADIPAGLATAKPPVPARVRGAQRVARPGAVAAVATGAYASVWAAAVSLGTHANDSHAPILMILGGGLVYLLLLAMCAGQMVASRRENRTGGQPPRRRAFGAAGETSLGLPTADRDGQIRASQHGHQDRVEAARRRVSLPALPA